LGFKAGYAITTGSKNIFIGHTADASGLGSNAFTNCAAFGYGATTNASNKYFFGNAAVSYIGGSVGWTNGSDGRFKINVTENVKGLEFINMLRPVTYNLNTFALDSFVNLNRPHPTDSSGNPISIPQLNFAPSTNIIHSGFIAQEVEQASQACGFTSSIVSTPASNSDIYGLSYAEFVVPLVKAVQQLDSANQAQQNQIDSLIEIIGNTELPMQQQNPNENNNNSGNNIDVILSSKTIVLNQNEPNPFKENTIIEYFIPDDSENVKIIFTDNKGSVLKEVDINEKGKGQLNVYASDLSSGIYTYTIVANGITIDTKRMMKTK
jgi:hypothetical protein